MPLSCTHTLSPQAQVAELVSAPVSNEQSAHQLRQELRLLRELLVSERKKARALTAVAVTHRPPSVVERHPPLFPTHHPPPSTHPAPLHSGRRGQG